MILHFPLLDSTNNYAKTQIDQLHSGDLILAEQQTGGKGRLGRNWLSPKGNLYCSLVYKNQTCDISFFPLLCAVAVSHVLENILNLPIKIKWPNDLVVEQKKICGILCESIILSSQIHVICGIGININTTAADFASAELPYATSYSILTGKTCELSFLAEAIAEEMEQILAVFSQKGFAAIKPFYESKLVNVGKTVKVIFQREELIVHCLGIAENGNLLCQKEDGSIFTVNSSEASVRGLYGYT